MEVEVQGYSCMVVGWESCAAVGTRKGRLTNKCDPRGREKINAGESEEKVKKKTRKTIK